MDIALESLVASAFGLDLPALDGSPRHLELSDVVNLRGGLHTEPGLVQLKSAQAERGVINIIRWPLGRAKLDGQQPLALTSVAVDMSFPGKTTGNAITGRASAGELATTALNLELETTRITSDARFTQLEIETGEDELSARVHEAQLENLQLQIGALLIRGATSLLDARLVSGGGGPLTVVTSSAEALELSLSHPQVSASAAGVELPRGFAFKGGELRIDELHIGAMRVEIPLGPLGQEPPEPTEPGPAVRLVDDVVCRGERKLFDLRDLDRLAGAAEIAVFVKAQLPVVGKYKLDRTFKIPIKDGSLDFVDVERQLGTIEDAFIDFAVRDNELVIKRDIPLLPTKGKKLISWPLSTVEEALARTRLVSLRTLTRFELVKPKEGDSKASISEVRVDVPTFTITMPPPHEDSGKDSNDALIQLDSFEPLTMAGGLKIHSDGTERSLDATIRGSAVGMRLRSIPVGSGELAVHSIRCGELVVEFPEWDGLRPRKLSVELKDLSVEGVTLRSKTTTPTEE